MAKSLSIFCDESGDFGSDLHSPYYIVSFVFHNKKRDIKKPIKILQQKLNYRDFQEDYPVHTSPLIRGEQQYFEVDLSKRIAVLSDMLLFLKHTKVRTKSFVVDKRKIKSGSSISKELEAMISHFIISNQGFFRGYKTITLYYDNGQKELNSLLQKTLSAHFSGMRFKRIRPKDFCLFQLADVTCTLELVNIKPDKEWTKSERMIFSGKQKFYEQFYNKIDKSNL